jgi:hypothetical protein
MGSGDGTAIGSYARHGHGEHGCVELHEIQSQGVGPGSVVFFVGEQAAARKQGEDRK